MAIAQLWCRLDEFDGPHTESWRYLSTLPYRKEAKRKISAKPNEAGRGGAWA